MPTIHPQDPAAVERAERAVDAAVNLLEALVAMRAADVFVVTAAAGVDALIEETAETVADLAQVSGDWRDLMALRTGVDERAEHADDHLERLDRLDAALTSAGYPFLA